MGFTCLSLLSLFFLFSFQEKKKRERSKEKRKANGKYINKKLENDKKERFRAVFVRR